VQNQFDCSTHAEYELELGIPWNVTWLQDDIFETLPETVVPAFVLRFLEVIPVGADLGLEAGWDAKTAWSAWANRGSNTSANNAQAAWAAW
jgi:hypothetical protein